MKQLPEALAVQHIAFGSQTVLLYLGYNHDTQLNKLPDIHKVLLSLAPAEILSIDGDFYIPNVPLASSFYLT